MRPALLSLAGSLLDHERLAEASHALATELAQRMKCERVAVGLHRGGRMRVLALSNNLHFTDESDAVRSLRGAMEEATELDAVIELPAPPEAPPQLAGARRNAGLAHLLKDQTRKAAAQFVAELRINPTDARSAYYLARCYSDLGDTTRARRAAELALTLSPDHPTRDLATQLGLTDEPTR